MRIESLEIFQKGGEGLFKLKEQIMSNETSDKRMDA